MRNQVPHAPVVFRIGSGATVHLSQKLQGSVGDAQANYLENIEIFRGNHFSLLAVSSRMKESLRLFRGVDSGVVWGGLGVVSACGGCGV